MLAHLPTADNYINGEWIAGSGTAESTNPADGSVLGHYGPGTAALAHQAVAVARETFDRTGWAASPRLRAAVLFELADRLEAARDEIADLIVAENGKLRREALGETIGAVSEARYYGGLARTILGRTIETAPGNFSTMNREAAGVAAIIVPWNAPVTLLVRSLGPALAAGCTVVIKPAPQTPLVHHRVMQCLHDCPSLPKGVVNSVNEYGTEVGEALVASEAVDVISFTGSSATGKRIMAGAAQTLKRLSLELGGKAPAIVFEDADLDAAVRELTGGALVMAGQICVAATRFLVHRSVERDFTARMTAAFSAVRTGPGADPQSQMGSLIDMANQSRIARIIEQAADEGELVLRGRTLDRGAFMTPSLFRIDNTASELVQEELFGPIVSIETFEDEKEAVTKANATRYGLAASVFTHDLSRATRVSRAIRAGTIWLNCHGRLFAEGETGGYRHSGLGRLHGPEGLNDFLETKHVYLEAGVV
ncbi:MAG: aldehyde dehydrogenase family protein [Alphaproteobacteria bacterium]|nr:aldehyde dehydrogenase family protein [Alphaproteobacteria bacterium]MBU1551609.1 aldehyde dehydrogenase family protein [Alphaproteobacteria bacterium]MBU2337344.1 aldehyde dehydrogenase family protein [Alphaproteobacteria bacterium]MBU2388087.1 aldehyde dehydrogenase family protein [Alphaproteobacteria bacterium]